MSDGSALTCALDVPGIYLPMADESLTVQENAPDDGDLIRRISGGETDRFADLISRHQRKVTRIVARRVPVEQVEEIVHDVFVRAYFGLRQFSGSVPFDHWLVGVAVRTCYDFWRGRKRDELPVSALTDEHHRWIERVLATRSDDQFNDQTRKREAAEVLDWALGQLSPQNRAVLTLVYLDGRSVREAAQLL